MTDGRFVCAINRGRDGYQVPLALHEGGLLERFVTDFYAPDSLRASLPEALRRRHVDDLPSPMTSNGWASFAVQSTAQLLRLPMFYPFMAADRLLAMTAGRVARAANAHLYCYAPHLPAERAIRPGTKRVVFEYHPLPQLSLDLLRADNARYPQTRFSFELERSGLERPHRLCAWRRADAVVCASTMTRRSLEHDGCPPERITVIPYGGGTAHPATGATAPGDRTEFLFVGQGMQRKGLHHLIEAWQASDPADARLTLVCYEIDPGIRAMIRSPTIRLLRRQSRAELDRLYAEADVFVMPSLIEGFGLVYQEALAHGCHLVGTDNTGLPDLRLPAEAATLVPAGDIPSLAHALVALRKDRLDRAAIRQTASRWQWADFRRGVADHARAVLAR